MIYYRYMSTLVGVAFIAFYLYILFKKQIKSLVKWVLVASIVGIILYAVVHIVGAFAALPASTLAVMWIAVWISNISHKQSQHDEIVRRLTS